MGLSGSKPVHQPNPELDRPWRNFDWGIKEDLKEKLENFSPSDPNVKDIKILVTGQVGAGKSSFINSINNAFQGRITSRVLVNSSGGGSHSFTQKLKGFTIRSGGKTLPFVFKDIMGLEAEILAGSQADDIINAVFGHVKDGYKFNEAETISHEDQHYTSDPLLSDQAFCLVYVIDTNTVELTNEKLIDKLKIIRKRISERGIPQVVVMTKVDEACPLVKKDLRKIYTSKIIKERMELCSAKIGVPLSNIFPVKNYHNEINTDDDIDVLILKALEQIVYIANDRLVDNESY
ncbi:interferon-induced protein 44-like [Pimephales promelas]|uniref:interferon-induced protein 44-like n=1 Tax=Pimephales promelas TaxID=90988 RepID=UPI001955D412|nr:interferon-induced protein 44-like [Pimephales promelas]XP_039513403.1 interferon-induced protein 44-like [Pimephales promelas]